MPESRLDTFIWADIAFTHETGEGSIQNVGPGGLFVRSSTIGKVGDEVQAGFIIGNSEVGAGSVFVEQLVWRLICLNGMRRGQSLRKMLQHLIAGGDLSQYGAAANAVTRLAHDAESYDRAFELEGLGGQVIDLAANDWQQVAQAA